MIQLKLNYGPAFSNLTKKTKENINFDKELTIKALFEYFYNKYGEKFNELVWDKNDPNDFHKQLVIILNGQTFRDEKYLETPLKDGDDISFLYVYFGG
ncbi:MAG: MoaD/ThiS family protein [Promethearchaeota archaeon]